MSREVDGRNAMAVEVAVNEMNRKLHAMTERLDGLERRVGTLGNQVVAVLGELGLMRARLSGPGGTS